MPALQKPVLEQAAQIRRAAQGKGWEMSAGIRSLVVRRIKFTWRIPPEALRRMLLPEPPKRADLSLEDFREYWRRKALLTDPRVIKLKPPF